MANRLNEEITEATKHAYEPQKQQLLVIRWDAMRTLMDFVINEVNQTRRSRDEIMQMRREEEEENARLRSARAV